jgi:hypothetical protein
MSSQATTYSQSSPAEDDVVCEWDHKDYELKKSIFKLFTLKTMYFQVIKYDETYHLSFKRRDNDKLENLFKLGPIDKYILENCKEAFLEFLDGVGIVLLSADEKKVIGSLTLVKLSSGTFKMTNINVIDGQYGIPRIHKMLCQSSIIIAKDLEARKLILHLNTKDKQYTNYRKMGFIEMPLHKGRDAEDITMEFAV